MTASASRSRIPNVLSIAGLDPSGGAGILADIKTISALAAYGCAVAAGLTAQNTQTVSAVDLCTPNFVEAQLNTLFADVRIDSIKIGMLGEAGIIAKVAECLQHYDCAHVVADPVMISKSGAQLLDPDAAHMLIEALLPQASVLTPNLPEAAYMLRCTSPETVREMYRAAEKLHGLFNTAQEKWVLLKGGHLPGNEVVDLLFNGDRMIEMRGPRIETRNTHGTGCTLSAAIAALAPQLPDIPEAVKHARSYVAAAIRQSDSLEVGHGHGPLHHFHHWWRLTAQS